MYRNIFINDKNRTRDKREVPFLFDLFIFSSINQVSSLLADWPCESLLIGNTINIILIQSNMIMILGFNYSVPLFYFLSLFSFLFISLFSSAAAKFMIFARTPFLRMRTSVKSIEERSL